MVPSGFWTQEKITNSTKVWNNMNTDEIHLTEISPAYYAPTNVHSVAENQTHLTTAKSWKMFFFTFKTCFKENAEK